MKPKASPWPIQVAVQVGLCALGALLIGVAFLAQPGWYAVLWVIVPNVIMWFVFRKLKLIG